MIADLQPYPEYKESEQAWLGRVPQHWPVLPNRALFAEVKDREHPDEEMLSVTITKGIIRQKALLTDSSKKDSSRQDKSAYKLVQPRDIAYNKMRAWQGAIGVSDFRGIISPAYIVMRLRGERDQPRYFHHLFRTPYFAKEAERWSYGITSDMWSLRPEHFKMIYTPQPPPEEQAAIVRFLDYANGRLERAIRAKRKVIALLNEQKQAIIHRAVTRGLDPTVPLKPSGIPWLGDIPKHWERPAQLSVSFSMARPSHTESCNPVTMLESWSPFFRITNISKAVLRCGERSRHKFSVHRRTPAHMLLSRAMWFWACRAGIGAAHVMPPELAGANLSRRIARHCAATIPYHLNTSFFFFGVGRQELSEYARQARRSTVLRFRASCAILAIPLPTRPEQAGHC